MMNGARIDASETFPGKTTFKFSGTLITGAILSFAEPTFNDNSETVAAVAIVKSASVNSASKLKYAT